MIWGEGQDLNLLAFYKELIGLRKNHSSLRRGIRTTVHADDRVLAYRRSDDKESLVSVLNVSGQESMIELALTETTLAFATSAECKLHAEGETKRIVLPPFGGMVIR